MWQKRSDQRKIPIIVSKLRDASMYSICNDFCLRCGKQNHRFNFISCEYLCIDMTQN